MLTRPSTCASVTVFRDIRKLLTYVFIFCSTHKERRNCKAAFKKFDYFDKKSKFGVFVKNDIVIILKLSHNFKQFNELVYIINYDFLLTLDVLNFMKRLHKRFPMCCKNLRYIDILNMLK